MTLAVLGVSAYAGTVRLSGGEGNWTLLRDGKPYFIKGASGGADKTALRKIGGNSFRTWGADDIEAQLETAKANGLTVMCGFWLGHAEHGFDYTNAAALESTRRDVLETVRKVKGHPNLLCWALGNEMEMNNPHKSEMWKFINSLAREVKSIDPNHPVTTVVAEIPDETLAAFRTLCPDIDFFGINSYGGAASVGERWRKAGMTKPYVITEYGAHGSWEGPKNAWGLALEPTSTAKGEQFAASYAKGVEAERGRFCLGSYAFTWGWKVESTPTWHGMLLPDMTRLASVEAVQRAWGEVKVANRCPTTGELVVSADDLADATTPVEAHVEAADPDGDALVYRWELVSDTGDYDTIGTGLPVPDGWEGAIVAGQGTPKATVKLPGGGTYLLYCYVFDDRGNAAYANRPIRAKGAEPKRVLKPVAMPYAVYRDGAPQKWYPSGYMGHTRALKVDEKCRENPRSGATCMRVDYLDHYGWAGIFWQDPPNDWGDRPGGANLSKATTLVFWAHGEKGGEKVDFFMGRLEKGRYHDTAQAKLDGVILKKEWTRYRIPLDGLDLSTIKTGFGFSFANEGEPFTFYLDDIEYVAD